MTGVGRCCRKTILLTRARKIDSRLGADAQFRFENPVAPFRLLHIPILQIVRGDFFDSIDPSWTSAPRFFLRPDTEGRLSSRHADIHFRTHDDALLRRSLVAGSNEYSGCPPAIDRHMQHVCWDIGVVTWPDAVAMFELVSSP